MAVSDRTQNALLAGLAAVAIGASGFAVWSVRQPHPSLSEGDTAPRFAQAAAGATPSPNEPTPSEPGGGSATDGVETTDSPSGTDESTEPAAEVAPSIDSWRDAWSGDSSGLLVIGDGFSNLRSQWVHEWAQGLADDRPVQINHWGEAADVSYVDPDVLSEAAGPELTIWNASRRGSSIADAAEHTEAFLDEAGTVDAVLVTLGRGSGNEDIAASLDDLMGELDDDLPVLVVVAPAGLYSSATGEAVLDWAEEHDDRVALVNLRESAPESPNAQRWAVAFDDALEATGS